MCWLSTIQKEIIIINDGSSDNTAEIIYEMKQHHDFKFVNLQVNRGKANALNEGVKHSSYDYVMCLDAEHNRKSRCAILYDG